MAFGLTCCDPVNLQGSTLPVDSDDLLERPEYWVGIKDVAAQPKISDELSFWITEKGMLLFSVAKFFGIFLQNSHFVIKFFRRSLFCEEQPRTARHHSCGYICEALGIFRYIRHNSENTHAR